MDENQTKHPIQPTYTDKNGVTRFKANQIVKYLLESGTTDLNMIAMMDFSKEDREQFAQLIGYSLSGFGELGYVSDETFETASNMVDFPVSEEKARIAYLQEALNNARQGVRIAAASLFRIHPDDLEI